MKKPISTSFTFFLKFILPGTCIVVCSYGTILAFSSNWETGLTALTLGLFLSLVSFLILGSVKKVSIDKDYIYISNFFKTNRVTLGNIKEIEENKFAQPRMVTINFKKPTYFGKRIYFLAEHEPILLYNEHPVIKEIQYRIKANSIKDN